MIESGTLNWRQQEVDRIEEWGLVELWQHPRDGTVTIGGIEVACPGEGASFQIDSRKDVLLREIGLKRQTDLL